MKTLFALFILLLGFTPTASASLSDVIDTSGKPQVAVVVFTKTYVSNDDANEIRDVLKTKFNYANSVVIYGDNQPKSPEFLEFAEKIQTDPANEKFLKVININALTKYGRDIKSDYVVLITVTPFFAHFAGWVDLRGQVSVIDVASGKYVECMRWCKEDGTSSTLGTKNLIKKIAADFNWSPLNEVLSDKATVTQNEEKKPAVVLVLADILLEKPELVERIRRTVAEKFKVKNVPIYIDDKPKTPEFLDFIGKVETDSAKQQTFILKKERLIEYGKNTNSNPVVAIEIKMVVMGPSFSGTSYQFVENVLVVDADANRFLSNEIYDVGEKKSLKDEIDYLINKLQNDFKVPVVVPGS